jgi:hypothetical protein
MLTRVSKFRENLDAGAWAALPYLSGACSTDSNHTDDPQMLEQSVSPSAMHIAIRWWIIVIWQPVLHKNPSASVLADCDRNQIITLINLLKWFVSRWLQCQYLQCSHPTLAMDQFVPYW